MDKQTVISVKNVSKRFSLNHQASTIKSLLTGSFSNRQKNLASNTHEALKNVSFEVKKGEFFGIVGRNGSGKSTLLKILAGIYQPNAGSVKIDGKLVPFIELGVGFNPELTGRENVYLNGALLGFSKKEIDQQYGDIVDFAEIEEFMDQKLKNYSSGMQVRLAFSMAVRAKADILLIDEVLAVGDADFQRKCFNYFNQLKNEKVTVVFVSHDMAAVREYCDRAMLLEKNEIVDIGSTDKVAEKYLRLFMGKEIDPAKQQSKYQQRWGDQTAKINKVNINSNEKTISIDLEITGNQRLENPVAGFRIRDAAGKEITGTNTKQENVKIPDLKKGSKVALNWEVPNVFRDGKYTLDLALQHSDEITVADWWNEAGEFTVKKARHLPYTVDPGFKTTLK